LRAAILYAEPEFLEKSSQPRVVVPDGLAPPELLHAQPNVFMESNAEEEVPPTVKAHQPLPASDFGIACGLRQRNVLSTFDRYRRIGMSKLYWPKPRWTPAGSTPTPTRPAFTSTFPGTTAT
jgi:hypothetical protein